MTARLDKRCTHLDVVTFFIAVSISSIIKTDSQRSCLCNFLEKHWLIMSSQGLNISTFYVSWQNPAMTEWECTCTHGWGSFLAEKSWPLPASSLTSIKYASKSSSYLLNMTQAMLSSQIRLKPGRSHSYTHWGFHTCVSLHNGLCLVNVRCTQHNVLVAFNLHRVWLGLGLLYLTAGSEGQWEMTWKTFQYKTTKSPWWLHYMYTLYESWQDTHNFYNCMNEISTILCTRAVSIC